MATTQQLQEVLDHLKVYLDRQCFLEFPGFIGVVVRGRPDLMWSIGNVGGDWGADLDETDGSEPRLSFEVEGTEQMQPIDIACHIAARIMDEEVKLAPRS